MREARHLSVLTFHATKTKNMKVQARVARGSPQCHVMVSRPDSHALKVIPFANAKKVRLRASRMIMVRSFIGAVLDLRYRYSVIRTDGGRQHPLDVARSREVQPVSKIRTRGPSI